MPRPNRAPELAAWLDCPGRCGRRQALVRRFGRHALRAAMSRGLVVELVPGLFAHASQTTDFATRVNAVAAWMPRGTVVSGLAALALFGLTERAPTQVTVIAPRNTRVRGPAWLRVVRSDSVARIRMHARVRCATHERAVIDAWVESSPRDRVSVVLEALRRSSISGQAILTTLGGMPRVTGRRSLERILHEAIGGIESYLEHRAQRTVLNTTDFRGLRRQVPVVAMGKEYTLDTYDEATRTVIEFDGARVHGTRAAKKRDNARDAALATLGMLTLRIGYDDVMTRPAWCRDVIRRTIAARSLA